MARADGSVSIAVNMDISKAERELAKLKEKIQKSEDNINKMQEARNEASEKSVFQGAELDAEKAKLQEIKDRLADIKAMAKDKSLPEEMRSSYTAQMPAVHEELSDQETRVRMLQTEFNKTANSVDAYDQKIKDATASLSEQKTKAGALTSDLANANREQSGLRASSKAAEEAGKRIEKLGNRIKGLVLRVFVFSLITSALRAMRDMLKKTISQNKDASKAIAQLKGALLTLAQPILNVIIPAFTAFVRVLTTVINAISRIVSSLFGTTAEKSAEAAKNLYDEQNAIEGVGGAAEETKRQLSGLDEVNKFESPDSGGGGGGSSGAIAPDFSAVVNEGISSVKELLVGEALLAIGAILAFTGVNIPLGIALMAIGAATIYDAAVLNWDSLKVELQGPLGKIVLLVGLAALAVGAILAFSGVNIPLGIALMAIGAVAIAPVVAANWGTIVEKLRGPIGVITAIVSAALLVIGIILIFSGVGIPIGIALILVGAAGLATVVAVNWDTIVGKIKGILDKINGISSGAKLALGILLMVTGVGIPLGLGLILAGASGLAAEFAPNWNIVVERLGEIWEGVKRWWNRNVAPKFTLKYWTEKFSSIGRALKDRIKDAINGAIELFNRFIGWVNEKMHFSWDGITIAGKQIVAGGSVQLFTIPQIPLLAQGAVIPPNREFMAVLGDQKSGTNIEAPLSTIEEGVANVMRRLGISGQGGFNGTIRIPIIIDGRTIYEAVIDQAMLRQMQTGVNPFELSY